MDGSCTGDGLTAVPGPFGNEMLFSGSDRKALTVNNHRIAALENDEVFVIVVHMWSRHGGFTTGPKRHLASVRSIKDVPFDSRSGLTARGDSVAWMLHEIGKTVHDLSLDFL
jgi:hypothetical protein